MKPCLMLEGRVRYAPFSEDDIDDSVLIPFKYIRTHPGEEQVQRSAKEVNEIILQIERGFMFEAILSRGDFIVAYVAPDKINETERARAFRIDVLDEDDYDQKGTAEGCRLKASLYDTTNEEGAATCFTTKR